MKTKLMQLLIDNRSVHGRCARIEQKAREATLYLYDAIVSDEATAEWWGGVSAQALVPQIDALDVDTIHLRINSPGGDVFAGQAIAAALGRNKAKVVAHVDGLAASAATAIAVACDEVLMASGSMFMIHNAWTIALGDRNDFLEVATLLEKIDGTLAKAYAAKTGKPVAEMSKLMDAETWFTPDEAIAAGFAKAIEGEEEGTEAKAKADVRWNLAAFEHAPSSAPKASQDAPTPADYERRARLKVLTARAA